MKLTYKGLTSFQIQTSSIDESKEFSEFLEGVGQNWCVNTDSAKTLKTFRVYIEDSNVFGWDGTYNSCEDKPVIAYKDFKASLTCNITTNKPITSDGGSSDYYKQPIPKGMLERWTAEGVIEAKDVMKLFLNNDYNFSNSFKAHCRVVSLRNGVGKEGASEAYDLRKGWFFAEDAYKDHLERSGE